MACFCTASELKMGFTFLKGCKTTKKNKTQRLKQNNKKSIQNHMWPAKSKILSVLLQKKLLTPAPQRSQIIECGLHAK